MNPDCISNITRFLAPAQAVKIDVASASKNFPKKVSLRSFNDIRQFLRWCQLFDTSNLEEVEYSIFDMDWGAPRDMLFGWVPPSVRVLRLSIYNDGIFHIPGTVEELHLNHCKLNFMLPDSIKRLTLEKQFKGRIVGWSRQLEELTIHGSESEYGNEIIQLDRLPDSIHTMFLTWGTAVQVDRWPRGLQTLTHETCDDDMLGDWLGIEHAPIPEGVVYNHIVIAPVFRGNEEEDYDW